MFTGLVEKVGKVLSVEDRRGQRRVQIKTPWADLQNGESVSVNGVCLTVAEFNPKGEALFFVSEESLERSNLHKLEENSPVNLELDPKYGRYCVEKGSISINGVSLTINALIETKLNEFMITFLIVPHTWKHTTFADLKIGDEVNVEVDILAKYIERLCPQLNAPSSN